MALFICLLFCRAYFNRANEQHKKPSSPAHLSTPVFRANLFEEATVLATGTIGLHLHGRLRVVDVDLAARSCAGLVRPSVIRFGLVSTKLVVVG